MTPEIRRPVFTAAFTALTALSLTVLALLVAACGPSSAPDETPGEADETSVSADETGPRGVTPRPRRLLGDPAPPFAAARTSSGATALVDVVSGAVLTEAPGGGLDGEVDIACDPWNQRVIVLETSASDDWGEISSHAITGSPGDPTHPPSLGPRAHLAWLDGRARVAASPFGVLVMEHGTSGPRWRLVSGAGPTSSAFGPRPASLWLDLRASGDVTLTALTHGIDGDALDLRAAQVTSMGVAAATVTPLPLALPSPPPPVRAVRASSAIHLLSVVSADLFASTLPPPGAPPPSWSPVALAHDIESIEHAISLDGGDTLVALSSGDVDVVAVRLGASGACAAGLDLPGEAEGSSLFFSRGLVEVGPARALAATSNGVFAVTVSGACPSLHIDVDPAFSGDALRGPIDACRGDE